MAGLLRFFRRHELTIVCVLVCAWVLLGLALAILSGDELDVPQQTISKWLTQKRQESEMSIPPSATADRPPLPPTGSPGDGL